MLSGIFKVSSLLLLLLSITQADSCEKGEDGHCMANDDPKSSFNQLTDWETAENVYQFNANDIHGKNVSLSKFRGHVLIIVNVASECGLTEANYKQLVQLHEKYGKSKGLEILAFPCNQFANQEPGTSEEILKFVTERFNVKFDMFEKVDVNGPDAHPLWKWLKTQGKGFITDDIKWNFTKFLIDKQGKVVSRSSPTTEPLEMEEELNALF